MTRTSALAEQFGELKIDALLVSALPNIRYLSGFTGSNGLLLVTPAGSTLFTDSRYTIQAAEQTRGQAKVKIVPGPLAAAAAPVIASRRLKRVGFEAGRMLYDSWQRLKETAPLGIALRPIGNVVEQMRMVKSEEEIGLIRQAVLTNSKAFEAALRRIRPNATEADIAAELEYQMRRHGAEKASFDTIVAAGTRTALPHASPGNERLKNDQLLLIDMGATREGYASDMTRMLFAGKPGRRVRSMYNAVLEAQLAAIDTVREGAAAGAVDRAARLTLKRAGLDKAFVHSTGHGLGLEIHEPPRLGAKDKTRLRAGMTITIEPGAYIEAFGGVRIEDTVLVTANGCEVLTPTSKELAIL
ncbi:MAG TPA: Xaa-Pro peptidase family protein [Bryobacteraceae bacterium]|nr:Xaa-Pro peptidase family protein [Bryobacteraceae bacterium]